MGQGASARLEAVAALLGELAREARRPDYGLVRLAAHLFALCSHFQERGLGWRSATLEAAPSFVSPEAALKALGQLEASSEEALYAQMLGALEAIDQHTPYTAADARAFPSRTQLASLGEADPDFGGEVWHWLRPPPAWARLREYRGRRVPARATYPVPLGRQLRNFGMLWRRSGVFPQAEATFTGAHSQLARTSGRALNSGTLRVLLAPLLSEAGPRFVLEEDGRRFHAERTAALREPEHLRRHVDALLRTTDEQNVNLLVLPELSVDGPLREHLREALLRGDVPSLQGVVAGSFHVWREGGGRPFNESSVLGLREALWTQDKRGFFRLTKRDVESLVQGGAFSAGTVAPQAEVEEGIQLGHALRFLDTSLGRLAVLICADAIDAQWGYQQAVLRAQPDWVFVVAMSPKTGRFHEAASTWAGLDISTFFVNARSSCREGEDLAFAYLGLAQMEDAPATRVRWRLGAAGLESVPLKHLSAAPLPWEAHPALDTSAEMLPGGMGLLLRLEKHWSFSPPDRS